MSISVGIVGLPNVGKSTLFNAITDASIQAENYPFCTIEPNVGIVDVPDPRLDILSKISGSEKTIPATLKIVDIAGLVEGASQGEGLGNQFLSHIRDVSAIVQMVRCFDDDDITHVHGKIDPAADCDIINLELILSDLQTVQKRLETQKKRAKSNDPNDKQLLALLEQLNGHLSQNKPVRQLDLSDEDIKLVKELQLLTNKKVIYVGNVSENDCGTGNGYTKRLKDYAAAQGDQFMIISAKIESELAGLDESDKRDYLNSIGLEESGLGRLARAGFDLLGLETFLTTGEKETRAWTIRKGSKAPQAAGVIHTDFETGFIRANVISYDDFVACNGLKSAKEKGLLRQEGKDYDMQDGDVVEFLFNV